jgi:hypothetical protein
MATASVVTTAKSAALAALLTVACGDDDVPVRAQRIDSGRNCVEAEAVVVGSQEKDRICGDLVTIAKSPNGECWNLPEHLPAERLGVAFRRMFVPVRGLRRLRGVA